MTKKLQNFKEQSCYSECTIQANSTFNLAVCIEFRVKEDWQVTGN